MDVDGTRTGSYGEQVEVEQGFVDRAYSRLDATREEYRRAQRAANAEHGVGNQQGDTERDAIAAHFGDLATRLGNVEERLVFGRLDGADGDTLYIGRAGLSDPDGSPLLIDWRAPAARPFYQATAAHPDGVARRRHITTRARRIVALEDELLDTQAAGSNGLALQGEGALMSALSEARDGRMGDIVATIQGEQDRVIRAPGDGLLVVQGGPGTGKTAVALHRAAYLLYTERARLERSGVLLVGPSRVFLRYIEQVLPSLGESGVVAVTMGDLVPGIHATAQDDEDVAAAKGDLAWTGVLREAVRDLERVPDHDQVLEVWNRRVALRPADVARARGRARRTGRRHNVAREGFALELIDVLARRIIEESSSGTGRSEAEPDPSEVEMWRSEVRDSMDARRAINLAWMPMRGSALLERLLARPDLLARLNARSPAPLDARVLGLVARPRGSALTVSDIPLVDELEELLGPSPVAGSRSGAERERRAAEEVARAGEAISAMDLGGGIVTAEMLAAATRATDDALPLAERAAADRTWTYGHVVVDEAQELSPMAWHALLRRCPSLSFTVVGDLDQRRGHGRPTTWAEELGPAARALTREEVLTISYRTPLSLSTLAEDVMADLGHPVHYPLTAVRDVPDAYRLTRVPGPAGAPTPGDDDPLRGPVRAAVEEETRRLDASAGEGLGRLAVVVGARRAAVWGADIEGRTGLDQRVSLLGAIAVKGLEFDTVVLVEPAELLEDGPGDLFVALTRATRRLHVVAAGQLPAAMEV